MAKKKVAAIVKIQIPAGKATPAPPVGTALGPHGVGIMDFVKQYNAATESQVGTIIPVEITVFEDRTFTFVLKTPPTPVLLREKAGRQGLRRRRARRPPAPSPRPTSKRSPRSRCPTSTPTTSRPPSSRSAAPPARWASTSSPDPARRHTRSNPHRSTGITSPGGAHHLRETSHVRQEVRRRDQEVRPRPAVHAHRGAGLVKTLAPAKFDETVDVAVRLGVDPRKADQMVRGTVALPSGTGKDVRVAVFAAGEAAQEAREAGADLVGADDLAAEIEKGNFDFDVAIATPDMMPLVGRLGRALGPRGLMPNPKTGTVTNDVGRAVGEFKGGKVEYRTDRYGNVHVPLGKASFDPEQLEANFRAVLDELQRAKPASAKGRYLRKITLSSHHGPRRQGRHQPPPPRGAEPRCI